MRTCPRRLRPARVRATGRFAGGPPASARCLGRYPPVHRGLSRPHPAGLRPLLLQGRRPASPPAAGVQRRRYRRQPPLAADLGRPGRQGDVGAGGDRAVEARRRLQRPPGERSSRARRHAHRHLAAGETRLDLPDLARGGAVRPDLRPLARHPGRLLRLPRGQRSRAAAVRRDARHDGDLQPSHRRAVSLEQVRAGHGGRLHRRHGECERDHAGGLAARCARVPRPAVVPAVAHPPRAGPPVVRRPGDGRELGQLLAQRGHGRVHAGPVLGCEAGRARGAGLLPRRVPPVPGRRRPSADAARHLQLEQRVPQGRAGARDAEDAARDRAVLGGHPPVSHHLTRTARRRATICARRCSTRPDRA